MGSNHDKHRFPTLEERIERAHAEHSIRIGYAMGDALIAVSRFLARKFRRQPAKFIVVSRQ